MTMEGEVDYGVIPIEDSVEGNVNGVIDHFRTHDVFIENEFLLDVEHCLLGSTKVEDLKVIGSHPQALGHCRNFLKANFPNLETKGVSSTADAARMASKDSSFGAIANERCAEIYGLKIFRRNIHDYGMNETRFLSITNEPISPVGQAKTSFLVYPKEDRPGLLLDVLTEFARQNINLSKIVSRPSRGSLGDYIFYLDVDITQVDPRFKSVVKHIAELEEINQIRSIGSYTCITKKDKLSRTQKLKLPENTIVVEGDKIDVNGSNLEIGVYYPVCYSGGEYLIRRPKKGVLQLYEVEST